MADVKKINGYNIKDETARESTEELDTRTTTVENKISNLLVETLSSLKNLTNLHEGDIVRTSGYYTVNDGGSSLYLIRLKTNDDVLNDMNIIELDDDTLIGEIIYEDKINPKVFGAYGDNNHDDSTPIQFAIDKAIELGKELYFTGSTYLINTRLLLKSGKLKISGDKSVTLHFGNMAENFSFQNGNTSTIENINITNTNGSTALNINETNIVETRVNKLNIVSNGYGILVNSNTNGGKDLFITDNYIKAKYDPIEINTTSTDSTKFHNVIISNNILNADNTGSGGNSGFAIGIATGKNITVTGNVIEESRQDGIHIEDGSESINVVGNIIKGCQKDGISLYKTEKSDVIPNITNNIIESANKTSGYVAIKNNYTERGYHNLLNISNNYIKNFDSVIFSGWYANINADGLVADNCNSLLKSIHAKNISGNITLKNNTKLGSVNSPDYPCVIESVTMDNLTDDWLTVTSSSYAIIKHLYFTKSFTVETQGDYQYIPLFKTPLSMKAIITNDVNVGANYSKAQVEGKIISDTYTQENRFYVENYGSITDAHSLVIRNGYLCLKIYAGSIGVGQTFNVKCDIQGELVFKNYNN